MKEAPVVQWIERQIPVLNVGGSSPFGRTTSEQSSLCSDVLLFPRNKMPTPLLLLSKPKPLPLGFGLGPLCGRLFFISDRQIDFDRSLQKENHSPGEWFSFWYFGGLWPPPILGSSMLGRAESYFAKVLDVKSKIVSMC